MSSDAEIRQHLFTLRDRCRDNERNNDYTRGWLEDLEANTLGSEGPILQSKIVETEDRIPTNPEEKQFVEDFEKRSNDRRAKIRKKLARRNVDKALLNELFPNVRFLHPNGNRAKKVLKGQQDLYANHLVEKAFKEFSLKQNFTVSREISRSMGERLWLRSTARDGATLFRHVRGFDNDFGFAIQFIDIDWLDINFSAVLPNGNEIRMGKEYNKYKECVAYHITNRTAGDWRWASNSGSVGQQGRSRIPASEITHGYLRERVDQSREIPWMVSAITRLRMLGKYEEAELVASLLAARKTGTWYTETQGDISSLTDYFTEVEPGDFEEATEPGQDTIAPPFWKYQQNDPTHPNARIEQFRKVMLQGVATALPGSSYHRLSQDPSNLSFSNLRGIELQTRDSWLMVQAFARENFHDSLFPSFLEAALMSGKIPLPMSKFDKFNAATWLFRKWKGVDPQKEAEANKSNLLLGNTTRRRIAAETSAADFDEIVIELILEEELLEASGLDALLLSSLAGSKAAPPPNAATTTEVDDDEEEPDADDEEAP